MVSQTMWTLRRNSNQKPNRSARQPRTVPAPKPEPVQDRYIPDPEPIYVRRTYRSNASVAQRNGRWCVYGENLERPLADFGSELLAWQYADKLGIAEVVA